MDSVGDLSIECNPNNQETLIRRCPAILQEKLWQFANQKTQIQLLLKSLSLTVKKLRWNKIRNEMKQIEENVFNAKIVYAANCKSRCYACYLFFKINFVIAFFECSTYFVCTCACLIYGVKILILNYITVNNIVFTFRDYI